MGLGGSRYLSASGAPSRRVTFAPGVIGVEDEIFSLNGRTVATVEGVCEFLEKQESYSAFRVYLL